MGAGGSTYATSRPVTPVNAGTAHQIGKYSDAIRVSADRDQIIVSGTPGLDSEGNVPADFEDEVRQVWANVEAILKEAGASLTDVVSGRQYLTRSEDFPAYVAVTDQLLEHEPALMLLVVDALAWPSFHVEVEVVASVPASE